MNSSLTTKLICDGPDKISFRLYKEKTCVGVVHKHKPTQVWFATSKEGKTLGKVGSMEEAIEYVEIEAS